MADRNRAVILGAAGFIGSHLTDLFLSRGWEVVGVDSLITGTLRNLEHLRGDARFQFVHGDICDPLEVTGRIDAILDFASPASPVDYLQHPMETLHVGSIGVENALKLAKRAGARFLLSSTSEVYGDPTEHPQRESYWGNVNPIGPRAVYDEAKRYAEAVTMAYHRYEKVDTRIARIFNTYGPRMRLDDGRVVPAFVAEALRGEPITIFGDGKQTRSFCYVADNVEAIWRLLHADFHEPVNVGNPHEMTVLEFAEAVQRLVGSRCQLVHRPLPVDDPRIRKPDISRAQALLGWEPAVDLDEGMRRTIDWFRQHV
ncbi:MAG TPA: UDP-glucuronic acid decarboxylase family protein [Anaeromyxobacteraceae bacterium]|jgi:dTDP-glucose 4,6-dehydratase|nr:UDP-glucuronic acid decarboxylase family protein [Anaeromyxobacteraceae bacterium]